MTFVVRTLMIGLQLAADGASSASFPKTYARLPAPDAPHPPTASPNFPTSRSYRIPSARRMISGTKHRSPSAKGNGRDTKSFRPRMLS